MKDIKGKVALVTGGGSGIGRALCLELAAEGAKVVVADIIEANAQKVADAINADGGTAIAVAADVCERSSIAAMKAAANAAFGPVQLLFSNAGATQFEALTDMSTSDIDWIMQVNLMGATNCLISFLPDMIAAGEGHVVATASMAGLLPAWIPLHAPYSAAKAGIIGLMLNMRLELADHGVSCSVLCPGPTQSGMKDNNASYRPARFGGPGEGPVKVPEKFFVDPNVKLNFRPAEDVAKMVIRAVRDDYPMIVTDPNDRAHFERTYVDMVRGAFDRTDAFERDRAAGTV